MKKLLMVWVIVGWTGVVLGQKRGYDTLPNLPEHYEKRLAQFRKEPLIREKIIFLGNSITEGGNWKKLLKDSSVINRGISGDNTFGMMRRMDEIVMRQPARLFILIGVNDFSKDFPISDVLENIWSSVRMVRLGSPQTRIFVLGVLPINPSHEKFPKQFDKESSIRTLNDQLSLYAPRMKYTYVDLSTALSTSNGRLDPKYTYDGLHLNAAGYVAWITELKRLNHL
jgi:lysophospholipase L1-like esterase